jgi:hypothetical protein
LLLNFLCCDCEGRKRTFATDFIFTALHGLPSSNTYDFKLFLSAVAVFFAQPFFCATNA